VIETGVATAPLLPFSVFSSRSLTAGNLTSLLSFAPVPATWFFLTLYLQGVRGYAPIPTGLIFVPMSLAVVGGSQLSFRVVSRVDPRPLFATGGMVAAVGLAWLGRLSPTTDLAWVLVPACIAMIGGGLMFAPSTVAATAGVAPDQDGLASGLLNTTRQIGGALGLAVLSGIAISTRRPGVTSGYGTAFTVGAAIFLAAALIGAIALPPR
jgi:Na+/melibiose symporter-like transporter